MSSSSVFLHPFSSFHFGVHFLFSTFVFTSRVPVCVHFLCSLCVFTLCVHLSRSLGVFTLCVHFVCSLFVFTSRVHFCVHFLVRSLLRPLFVFTFVFSSFRVHFFCVHFGVHFFCVHFPCRVLCFHLFAGRFWPFRGPPEFGVFGAFAPNFLVG